MNRITKTITFLYDNVNASRKKDVIKMTGKISGNLKSDLGYMVSIFSMNWCKLSPLPLVDKKDFIKKLYEQINETFVDCKTCKEQRKEKDSNC